MNDEDGLFRFPFEVAIKRGVILTSPGTRRENGALSAKESVALLTSEFRGQSLSRVSGRALYTLVQVSDLSSAVWKVMLEAEQSLLYFLRGGYWDIIRVFWKLLSNPIFLNVPNMRYGYALPEATRLGVADLIAKDSIVIPEVIRRPAGRDSKGREFLLALNYSGFMSLAGFPDVYRTQSEIANRLENGLPRRRRGFLSMVLEHLGVVAEWSKRLRMLMAEYGRDEYLSTAEQVLETHANRLVRTLRSYLPFLMEV